MLVGRLSRERLQVSSPASRVPWLDHQVAGYILTLSGTMADLVAGWLILERPSSLGILVHILAVLLWALGLHFLHASGTPHLDDSSEQTDTDTYGTGRLTQLWKGRIASVLHRPEFTALLLGLLLFPGLIPLGWCLGFGLVRIQRTHRHTRFSVAVDETAPDEILPDGPVADRALSPSVQVKRVESSSLVDAIRAPNVEVRRGAIAVLGQLETPDAVAMLRCLLTDRHADVRLDASITLARIEAKFSREVNDATKACLNSPPALKAYATQCFEYGSSGLLDPVSSRFYLAEARRTLHEYLTCDPESVESRVMIARLHAMLDEPAEALHAISYVLSLPEPPLEAFHLGMEIAFRERKWQTLIALVRQIREASLDMDKLDDKWSVIRWWATVPCATGEKQSLATWQATDGKVMVTTDERGIRSQS